MLKQNLNFMDAVGLWDPEQKIMQYYTICYFADLKKG